MAKLIQLDSNPDCFDPRACVVTTMCTSPEVGMWARCSGLCPASVPGRQVLPGAGVPPAAALHWEGSRV